MIKHGSLQKSRTCNDSWPKVTHATNIDSKYLVITLKLASCAQIISSVEDTEMFGELRFREIEHTADRGFRVRSHKLPELFECAAHAMFAMQGAEVITPPSITRRVTVSGGDRETLLVNWLNELLYLQEIYGESYSRFDIVEFSDTLLRARIHGAPDAANRRIIKAVTFHGLNIKRLPHSWEATVIVDI